MDSEIEKSKVFFVNELVEYASHSVMTKLIIKKNTGNVSAIMLDSGEALSETVSPFDTFVLVTDGSAEIRVDDKLNTLSEGKCMIIPAHSRCLMSAAVRFKMISTTIKSGYEEVL